MPAWVVDAAKAVRDVAVKPVFPGDQDPLVAVLDKFVVKSCSECHNGGELGKDECPPCRAFRTEEAETRAAEAQAALDGQVQRADVAEGQVRDFTGAVEDLSAEREDLKADLAEAQKALKDAEEARAKAEEQSARDIAERGSAQREAQAQTKRATQAETELAQARAELAAAREHAKAIVGVN